MRMSGFFAHFQEARRRTQAMEEDDKHPTKKQRTVPETTAFEAYDFSKHPFDQKWLGFLHTVCPCLVSESGAIITWRRLIFHDMRMWVFTISTGDSSMSTIDVDIPMSTIEVSILQDHFETMLTPFLSGAAFSETYITQQLMNYVRENHTYSTNFCHENRRAILDAPYFICDTKEEVADKIQAWIETESGTALTRKLMSKFIQDNPLPKPTKDDKDTAVPKEEEEEFTCMICMDAEPTTVVKPCGHVVVCSTCSPKLSATADARMCVRCRTIIESVEDLVSGTVTFV